MSNTPTQSPLQQRLVDAIEADAPDGVGAAVAEGADVNQPLPNSATPLMWAIAKKKPAAVDALLKAGADVRARDADGDTSVSVAARFASKDDLSILEMVLAAGADPNTRMRNGDPPITFLTRSHNLKGVALMGRHGADLNARLRTGTPLLIEAALIQDWDVAWTLLEGGADPLIADGKLTVASLLGNHVSTPPDSPLYPWKVKVWHHLASRGEPVPPLPDAS